LVFFIALFPELILRVFFGEAFVDAGTALLILMLSMVMVHFRIIYGFPLVAWNDERFLMIITIVGASLNVVLNYFLIPDHGIQGAAYASLVSQIIIALGAAYRFKTRTNALHLKLISRSLSCIGVAAICVWMLEVSIGTEVYIGNSFGDNILALVRNLIVFGAIYLVSILFLFRPKLRQLFNPEP
jgi:O-antigen/teichoic acid export membrane protein